MKKLFALVIGAVLVLGLGFAPVKKEVAEKPPVGGAPVLAEKPPIGGSPVLDEVVVFEFSTMEKPPIGG